MHGWCNARKPHTKSMKSGNKDIVGFFMTLFIFSAVECVLSFCGMIVHTLTGGLLRATPPVYHTMSSLNKKRAKSPPGFSATFSPPVSKSLFGNKDNCEK
jgi:hypothetical protein